MLDLRGVWGGGGGGGVRGQIRVSGYEHCDHAFPLASISFGVFLLKLIPFNMVYFILFLLDISIP